MSVKISRLTEPQRDSWDEYVRAKQASIYHDTRWMSLIKKVFGHDSYYLVASENKKMVGVLPLVQLKSLMFGNFLVSMPFFNYGGIVADTDEVADALLQSAHDLSKGLGCSHVEMRFDAKQANNLSERIDKVTMLLGLPDADEVLWHAIGSKRRAQVKRPIREGAEFFTGGVELLEDFYSVFSKNMRDLGTPVYSRAFFKEILTTFKEDTFIAVVRLKGEAVGAGLLIGHNGKLEIPWASTLREYNRFGINMYLYWNILKVAIEKNYKVFDFGRSSKDAGTLKFKKQWGAIEKQLYWYYDLPEGGSMPGLSPSNKKFSAIISVWKKMPLFVTNLLGPGIVKNLP